MGDTPGIDHPEERMVVDLVADSRGDVLVAWVESADGEEIAVSAGLDRDRRPVRLLPGERIEVVWAGPTELRAMPTELVDVGTGSAPVWRLRPLGPPARGQRRSAVRAPSIVQVLMSLDDVQLPGTTVDLSESGIRAVFGRPSDRGPQGDGTVATDPGAVDVGAVVPLVLCLDGDEIPCRGEVVRRIRREDRRPELSIRFVGLPERTQDRIRRHVFAELRDLRSRGLL